MFGRGRHAVRSWWPWLGLWTAVGLGIRVASLFGPGRTHRTPGGDAYYYHNAANLLVAGKGFVNPFVYYSSGLHHQVQTAAWPPLFVMVLAVPSVVGPEIVLRPPGVVLHHRSRRHRALRLHRSGDRRAPGGPPRRLSRRRLPEHLDERRAGPVRGPLSGAGGTGAVDRLPLLEAARARPRGRAGGVHRRGRPGPGRAHPAGGVHHGSAGADGRHRRPGAGGWGCWSSG